jgi:hypothetical protein
MSKHTAICQVCGIHKRGYERIDNWLTEEACPCGDPENATPVFGTPEWNEWRYGG